MDIEYPEKLHDAHDEYPLIPHHLTPTEDVLSTDQRAQLADLNLKVGKTDKLVVSLLPKKNIVLHYKQLQQAIKYGVRCVKVRKVLSFQQSAWLRPYIQLNTKLRQEAKSPAQEATAKLMNNAGKGSE